MDQLVLLGFAAAQPAETTPRIVAWAPDTDEWCS
jgi:hypothetical protein